MNSTSKLRFHHQWLLETICERFPEKLRAKVSYPANASTHAAERVSSWIEQTPHEDVISIHQQILRTFKYSLVALFIFALFSGVFAASSALSSATKTVNLPIFLLSTLGMHFLAFVIWCVMLRRRQKSPLSIPQLILNMTSSLWNRLHSHGRSEYGYALRSFSNTARALQISKPLLSLLSHLFWLVFLISSFVTTAFMLLFAEYYFVWETTLLSETQLQSIQGLLNQSLGWFQVQLPVFARDTLSSAAFNSQIGKWLLLFVAVYGILIRLLAALICILWAIINYRRRTWSESSKSYLLFNQYQMQPQGEMVDQDAGQAVQQFESVIKNSKGSARIWIEEKGAFHVHSVDFELGVVTSVHDLEALHNQHAQPWDSLVIMINANHSPDRGSLSILRYAVSVARVVSVQFFPQSNHYREIWCQCLQAEPVLSPIKVHDDK